MKTHGRSRLTSGPTGGKTWNLWSLNDDKGPTPVDAEWNSLRADLEAFLQKAAATTQAQGLPMRRHGKSQRRRGALTKASQVSRIQKQAYGDGETTTGTAQHSEFTTAVMATFGTGSRRAPRPLR